MVKAEIQRQKQKELVNPRLPENAKIPVPHQCFGYKGQEIIVKFPTIGVDEDGRGQNPTVCQRPQCKKGGKRIRGESGHDNAEALSGLGTADKIGEEHPHQNAQQDAEIHHLPVFFHAHGDENGCGKENRKRKPIVENDLQKVLALIDQKYQQGKKGNAQAEKLRFVKA